MRKMSKNLYYDAQDIKDLRVAYDTAGKKGVDTFMFQERQIVTEYAKYLLECLEK